MKIRLLLLTAVSVAALTAEASAGCVSRPPAFKLAADTMRWSINLAPDQECVQGLRYAAMQIEDVGILKPPKNGRLTVSGPSFHYFAASDFHGTDEFSISVSGLNRKIHGSSLIEVEVIIP